MTQILGKDLLVVSKPKLRKHSLNYGERFTQSLGGSCLGLGIIVVSSGLIWWNEHNYEDAFRDLRTIFKNIKSIGDFRHDHAGKIIHFIGKLGTTEGVEDSEFIKKPPSLDPPESNELIKDKNTFLRLKRVVEHYQWVETKEEDNEEIRYFYNCKWQSQHVDSSRFRLQREHENPPALLESQDFWTSELCVGPFKTDPSLLSNFNTTPYCENDMYPLSHIGTKRVVWQKQWL